MEANLETLKSNLATIVQDGPSSLHMLNDDMIDGWNDIADQFALYVYKVTPNMSQSFAGDTHISYVRTDEPNLARLLPLRRATPLFSTTCKPITCVIAL